MVLLVRVYDLNKKIFLYDGLVPVEMTSFYSPTDLWVKYVGDGGEVMSKVQQCVNCRFSFKDRGDAIDVYLMVFSILIDDSGSFVYFSKFSDVFRNKMSDGNLTAYVEADDDGFEDCRIIDMSIVPNVD